jgi:DNA-binding NarL/FixJ family response regulator
MGTSVIIADDHPIFRAGLAATLERALPGASIRQAGDMAALRDLLRQDSADLVLLDIFFPGLEPLDDIRRLRAEHPLTAILLVSMLTERAAIERLLRAGANGFLSKSIEPDEMARGVTQAFNGERPVMLGSPGRNRAADPVMRLPARQLEVLRLICMGFSNKEIARELKLSPATIRAHISALFHKLGVSTRAAAASYGAAHAVFGSGENAKHRGS